MKLRKVNKKQNKKKAIIIAILILVILAILLIHNNISKIGKKANNENELQLGNITIDITKVTSEDPNPPVIGAGMIPIKWNEEKGMWEITTKEDPDWYDYENDKWANVMLSDR